MTQTNAVAALGVVVTLDGNPIAEVLNVNGVSVSRKMLDATNFESPNYYEEAIAGLKSAKDVTLDMNFIAGDTNGQLALLAALEDGLAHSFVVTFPTKITATWMFSAYSSPPGSPPVGAWLAKWPDRSGVQRVVRQAP